MYEKICIVTSISLIFSILMKNIIMIIFQNLIISFRKFYYFLNWKYSGNAGGQKYNKYIHIINKYIIIEVNR